MVSPLNEVRVKATEQALTSLRSGILDGSLPGGARLREVQLAKSMAVSRTPVREAIARLVTEGLVTRDELGNATVFRPNLDDLTEIYEIRIALESLAARFAVEEPAPDLGASLDAHLDQLNAARPGRDWAERHEELHLALYENCGRPRLLAYIRTLRAQSEPYVRLAAQVDRTFADDADRQHQEMARLVGARDGAGIASLVRTHLQATLNRAPDILGLQ
ncbi:MAG: GntR family transcriptional regulator [Candidatus Dormibacteria bacterium]|jgi:DNA-binding GntR family transcriptional regulator